MNGYLAREYGRLGFIICRDKQPGLEKGRELEAFREFYLQGKVIVGSRLSAVNPKCRVTNPYQSLTECDVISPIGQLPTSTFGHRTSAACRKHAGNHMDDFVTPG